MNEITTIFEVWGNQQGYVRLPRKLRSNSSEKGPNNHEGKWEEKMFQWPQQQNDIIEWIRQSHQNHYDLYWCPSIYNAPRGIKDNIKTVNNLYADLDEKNPNTLPPDLKPSMCWESSPGRYAAVWLLDKEISASDGETLNKNLTYFIGADKGGWDLTQVLRVPGLRNYKYEGAPKGKLLWFDNTRINSISFYNIPDVTVDDLSPASSDVDDILFESSTEALPDLVRPYLSKLNTKTLELLFTPNDEVLLADRSERLWELECKLLEAGIPSEEVVKLVAACNWNKYKGRKDETRRILTEVQKATNSINIPISITKDYSEKKWTNYSDLISMTLDDPGWMIEGVWQKSSHGMIAGEPKTYKSVIATDMAVSVASGNDFLGKFPVHHQGPVMYIQEENSPWLVKDRLLKITTSRGLMNGKAEVKGKTIKIKYPPELPMYFLNNMGFDFTSRDDRDFLEESIKDIRPVLVIFDPLYLMLGGTDENSSKDIRPVLNWLLHIRYTYKTSVIILHHWNKAGKSERGGQRMLGSVLFHGWVESAIYTSVVNEEKHEISLEREFRSFSKPSKIGVTFKFGEPGDYYYEPVLTDCIDNNDDAVYDLISQYAGLTEDEIKESLGLSKKQVQDRLKSLVKTGKVIKNGNQYFSTKTRSSKEEEEIS